MRSYLHLHKLGCPVLKSCLLTDLQDSEMYKTIIRHIGSSKATLRFQYTEPENAPRRGGNCIKISQSVIKQFWNERYILWLMEGTNRLSDLYAININYNEMIDKITFEIVGRGFDASDINRGDITPHQIITVERPELRGYYDEIWKRAKVMIINSENYRQTLSIRKQKLLKMNCHFKEDQFEYSYVPISLSLLEKLDRYAQWIFESYKYKGDITISVSVLENGRIVFWDAQTPKEKYRTFIR